MHFHIMQLFHISLSYTYIEENNNKNLTNY